MTIQQARRESPARCLLALLASTLGGGAGADGEALKLLARSIARLMLIGLIATTLVAQEGEGSSGEEDPCEVKTMQPLGSSAKVNGVPDWLDFGPRNPFSGIHVPKPQPPGWRPGYPGSFEDVTDPGCATEDKCPCGVCISVSANAPTPGIPPPPTSPPIPMGGTATPHFAVSHRDGEGSFYFFEHDGSGGVLPDAEVRHVDGTVSKYHRVTSEYDQATGNTHGLWFEVETIDPYDNHTFITYDTDWRVSRISRPDGVDEVYSYSESTDFIASHDPVDPGYDPSKWNSSIYSGVQIRVVDRLNGDADLGRTRRYLFWKEGQSTQPFGGDRLYREYSPLAKELPALTGSTHDVDANSLRYTVRQYDYHVGTHNVETISLHSTDSYLPAGTATSSTDVAKYTYTTVAGLDRISKEELLLLGQEYNFIYVANPQNPDQLQFVTRTDIQGTVEDWELDNRQRIVQRIVTPTAFPRTGDADSGGNQAPGSVTHLFEYSSCMSCAGKPSRYEFKPQGQATGRVTEYDYDTSTGLLTEKREPNPDGSATQAVTKWEWEPAVSTDVHGRYRLKSHTLPDGQKWTYSYITQPRLNSSYGTKDEKVTLTSPPFFVQGDATPHTVTSENDYSPLSAPTFVAGKQIALVGLIKSTADGDGVVTNFTYDVAGRLDLSVVNQGGGDDEVTVQTVYNRLGELAQITNNKGSSAELVMDMAYDGRGRRTSTSSLVDGVTIEEKFYYDRWGNLAVELRTNKRSDGTAPDDFGPTPRSETARDWIRNEYHYDGGRLFATLRDRRPLDRDDSGPASDALGAQFQLTAFTWTPDGQLASVGNPNGSETSYTYDGYGTLYKVEKSSPGQPVVSVGRYFIDEWLQTVRAVQGAGVTTLATDITRNAAGVVAQVTEPQVAPPSEYPWASVASAIHERDFDVAGRVVERRVFDGAQLLKKTKTIYDEIGRPKTVEIYDGTSPTPLQSHTTTWQGATQVARRTGPAGRYIEYAYDSVGRVTERVDSLPTNPNKVVYDYLPKSSFVELVTQKNWDEVAASYVDRETRYVHDALGRKKQIRVGPGGSSLDHAFTYFTAGGTESYTDPVGKVTKFLPDGLGRLVERFMPGTTPIWNGTEWRDWTGISDRSEKVQIDGLEHETKTVYDFAGRAVVVMEPGATVEPTAAAKHQANARFMTYDAASRLDGIYAGDDLELDLARDGVGRLIQRRRISPQANFLISNMWGKDSLKRNSLGQIIETRSFTGVDGNGDNTPDEFCREVFDRDVVGRTTLEHYAWSGAFTDVRVLSGFSGGDPFRSSLTIDNTIGEDLYLAYAPDALGRVSAVDWSLDGTSWADLVDYKHEGGAIRERSTTQALGLGGVGTPFTFDTTYSYDSYGRMIGIDQSFDATAYVDFIYDDASNLVKEGYIKQGGPGRVGDRFSYDEHHRLLDAWMGSDQQHWNETDPSSGVGTFVKKLTYNLDAGNNRDDVEVAYGSGSPTTADYTLEADSNRYATVGGDTLLYDGRGSIHFDGTLYYVFDALDRLSEVYTLAPQSQTQQSQASGVAESSTTFEVADFSALDYARQQILQRMLPRATTLLHQATDPGVQEDARQELSPTVAQSTTTTSQGSSQDSVQMELLALYFYDPMNRRVLRWVKNDATHFYAYDGWQEVQDISVGTILEWSQSVWGEQVDELLAVRHRTGSAPWANRYVAEGGAHCPSRLMEESGSVVEYQEYDPFGRGYYWSNSASYGESQFGNAFSWKSAVNDPETGLLLMRNRYYSPRLARFVSSDPLGVWFDAATRGNSYDYGVASPLVHSDPMGTQTLLFGPVGNWVLEQVGMESVSRFDEQFTQGVVEVAEQTVEGAVALSSQNLGAQLDLISGDWDSLAERGDFYGEVGRSLLFTEQLNAGVQVAGDVASGDPKRMGRAAANIGMAVGGARVPGLRAGRGGFRPTPRGGLVSFRGPQICAPEFIGPRLPRAYSVAFEVQLPRSRILSRRRSHNRYANRQLADAMDADADFARAIEEMGADPWRGPRGGVNGRSPGDWTWHHNPDRPGSLELVPDSQHTSSLFQDMFHPPGSPGGRRAGGFSLWGAGGGN